MALLPDHRAVRRSPLIVRTIDAGHELSEALNRLAQHWTLAVPTALASLACAAIVFFAIGAVVVSVVAGALVGHTAGALAAIGAGAAAVGLSFLAIAVLASLASTVVIAAARDVWEGRDPDFGAAWALTMRRLPDLAAALALVGLIALVPIALCIVLIGFPMLLVLAYLMMYVTPAIVLGGEDAPSAIRTSFRLATAHANVSAIAFAGICAAFFVGRFVDAFCIHVPGLGLLTAFAVGGFTAAYGALVRARFYALLRGL